MPPFFPKLRSSPIKLFCNLRSLWNPSQESMYSRHPCTFWVLPLKSCGIYCNLYSVNPKIVKSHFLLTDIYVCQIASLLVDILMAVCSTIKHINQMKYYGNQIFSIVMGPVFEEVYVISDLTYFCEYCESVFEKWTFSGKVLHLG